jgi:cell division protein FtsB
MEDTTLIIGALATLIAAFGIKEIWILAKVIEELKEKIQELEEKIDKLVDENTALKVKIGKMEEQLLANAASRSRTKRTTK